MNSGMARTKHCLLFLARARIDHIIIEAIRDLQPEYDVVVICGPEEYEEYTGLSGIVVKHDISIQDAIDYRARHSREFVLREAERLEAELGIGSFETNSNYMLYDVFVSRYARIPHSHRLVKEYLIEINVLSYALLKKVCAKYGVNYAYYETVDLPISYLMQAMARKGMVSAFEFRWLPLLDEHRVRIASGLARRSDRIEHIYKNRLYSTETLEMASLKLTGPAQGESSFYNNVHRMTLIEKALASLKRGIRWTQTSSYLRKHLNSRAAMKYFDREMPLGRIVAIFLQHTPEASMCSQAPLLVNQHIFVQQIAIYAKAGYTIVVKEHPRTLGNREEAFYADLKTLPNVCLLPPDFDNEVIIERADAIIAATTTALALTSLLKNKYVFMFADTFIDFFDNVIRVNSPAEFWRRLLEVRDVVPERIKVAEFLAACMEGSHVFPPGTKGFIFPKHGGGHVLATALRSEIKFIEETRAA